MNLALEPRACRMLFWALLVVFQICGGPLWGFSVGARQASGGAASPSCQADSVHGISWTNGFDARGNVVSRAGSDGSTQQLAWDALGRLISVTTPGVSESQAYYDGFNRRIRTEFTPSNGATQTLDSAFDPHIEFLELAVTASQEGQRVWKVYGPDVSGVYGGAQGVGGLEALVDEATGTSLGVVNDLFGNVAGTVGGDLSFKSSLRVGAYGPLPGQTAVDTGNLLQSLAAATVWQGRRLDPTGFYWMGARYYDPGTGRFLSPDPLGHDASLSLYDYAGGDPVNQLDPDGRCVKGLGHGTVDLFKGAWETAYNVGGGIGYRLTGLFSEEAAETVYGEQWRALERTSQGIGKILGGNFEGLGTTLTGGEGKSTAYRVGYVVPQIASLLFGGRNLTGTGSRGMAEGTGISAAGTRTAAVETAVTVEQSVAAEATVALKTPASFFQSMRIEVDALRAQGLSRSEAFSQIRRFNAGNSDGYLFHFTNPTNGRAIVKSGEIWVTQRGLGGAGVYTGTTPAPNFFQRYFSPVGWGVNPGSGVRIPLRVTPELESVTRTPFLPRWTRIVGDGQSIPLSAP